MNYWLFYIIEDFFPGLWERLVLAGVAAQQYPEDYENKSSRTKNVNLMNQIRRGDKIIAAFGKHRFAGYGDVLSGLYQDGPRWNVRRADDPETYTFRQRVRCSWTVLTPDQERPYRNYADLKAKAYTVKMDRGNCVTKIDRRSFEAIRKRLDCDGAKSVGLSNQPDPWPSATAILDELQWEDQSCQGLTPQEVRKKAIAADGRARKTSSTVSRHQRNPNVARDAKSRADGVCQLCGENAPFEVGAAPYLEVHHIKWLGRGGRDTCENTVALCPNCHRKMHCIDDARDKRRLRVAVRRTLRRTEKSGIGALPRKPMG